LHIAQQMPLPLTISCSDKSRLVLIFLVLPFWYLLTRVVPDIFQKSSKTVVCVCMCVLLTTFGQRVWHNVTSVDRCLGGRGGTGTRAITERVKAVTEPCVTDHIELQAIGEHRHVEPEAPRQTVDAVPQQAQPVGCVGCHTSRHTRTHTRTHPFIS